jgi:hypothetical protein
LGPHVAALYVAHKKAVAEQLQKARNKVFSLHRSDETDVAEIAVSYDGTWSKRGYTANFRVGFVISVKTGKVLDFDFELKLCSECTSAKKDLGEDSAEYAIWYGVTVGDDEDDYPLARFSRNDESNDTGDAPLAQFASRNQEK